MYSKTQRCSYWFAPEPTKLDGVIEIQSGDAFVIRGTWRDIEFPAAAMRIPLQAAVPKPCLKT